MHGSPTTGPSVEPPSPDPGPGATSAEGLDALRRRLTKAEADRDTWRLSGDQERYVGAHCLAEALELQIEARLRQLHA